MFFATSLSSRSRRSDTWCSSVCAAGPGIWEGQTVTGNSAKAGARVGLAVSEMMLNGGGE
ncbi:hypothetical protein LCGC14_1463110 [marine sediment metagenome]|uniref:Uncharacterized protein n=1 Tax=marine sediment metagenome TaxID=412755 RepID=A0A0F9K0I6_9ZZZZ